MNTNNSTGFQLIKGTIGLSIDILSNDFDESMSGDQIISSQRIVFAIRDEEPDAFAIGVLFILSALSFAAASPKGVSEEFFQPDEDWSMDYFVKGLKYENGTICFAADYESGRRMKTDIQFRAGGKIVINTQNRGRSAEKWLTLLQGKKHLKAVK